MRVRFIPVDTGNTMRPVVRVPPMPVHPRGYGEHSVTSAVGLDSVGSSPWIRGTPLSQFDNAVRIRFIPVDTGNTNA